MPTKPDPHKSTVFRGFRSPHYTQVPDELFDELLPELSGSELKVLLYIVRRTFGFKRDRDAISLSQMLDGITTRDGVVLDRGAGVSKPTLLKALRALQERRIVFAERQRSSKGGDRPTVYRLNVQDADGPEAGKRHPGPGKDPKPPVVKDLDHPPGEEDLPPPRSKDLTTQETVEQETVTQETEDSNLRRPQPQSDSPNPEAPKRPTPISAILKRRAPQRDYGEARQRIAHVVDLAAREFNDQAELRSSVSRAYNTWERSGLPMERFESLLYEARAITKESATGITKHAVDPRLGVARKNKMAYFFAVLEDRVGQALGKPPRAQSNDSARSRPTTAQGIWDARRPVVGPARGGPAVAPTLRGVDKGSGALFVRTR